MRKWWNRWGYYVIGYAALIVFVAIQCYVAWLTTEPR